MKILSTVQTKEPKDASPVTKGINSAILKELDFADQEDFRDAHRGLIAALPGGFVNSTNEELAWDLNAYGFLGVSPDLPEGKNEPPATVNPSLWRMARLNMAAGLFKVVDRVYQVRGLDVSNMTIIEGEKGVIVIDPLTSVETARAAFGLYKEHRGDRPVVAMIYTHSHLDHWAGVKGVLDPADVQAGRVDILAPEGFLEAAISENVTAGTAMSRRSHYWYGIALPRGERGQVDAGLGKAISMGSVTLIPPTDNIYKTGERRLIDGVEMVFHMVPDTEAPTEMMIFFPQFKVFNSAELACHTLHNVLTLRGAQVRDAHKWSQYLNEAIEIYGNQIETLIAQHHWPVWGHDRCIEFLKDQRDMYKYIHDQTLRLANHGYVMGEIGPMLQPPPSLARRWYLRGYYGSCNHDSKAVYQKYIGWYDMNPANLNPLPPVESAQKYVEYMGGPEKVLTKAREDFSKGEYRWVAQVVNQVVFADPENNEARELQADTLEQLGYQAEASTWRNNYLTAAHELRHGVPRLPTAASADVLTSLTLPMIFDYMGIRLNGPKADGKTLLLNWNFTDVNAKYVLTLENCALTYVAGKQVPDADATITLTRAGFDAITLGQTTIEDEIQAGRITILGETLSIAKFFSLLDVFTGDFNIVTP